MRADVSPIGVFRAREVRESFRKMKEEWVAKHKRTEVALFDKVLYEQGRKHTDQQATWDQARFLEEQLKTVGREVVNRKRAEYMQSKTVGGKDMIRLGASPTCTHPITLP